VLGNGLGKAPKLKFLEKLRVAIDFLRGLQEIHDEGLAHCDLKPENALKDGDRVKIIDFGMSTKQSTDAMPGVRGTKGYIAPELYGQAKVDLQKVDMWAAGMTVADILAGGKDDASSSDNAANPLAIKDKAQTGAYFQAMFAYAKNKQFTANSDDYVEAMRVKFWAEFGMPNFISNLLNHTIRKFFSQDPKFRIPAKEAAKELEDIVIEVEHLIRLCSYLRSDHNQAGTPNYIPGAPGRKQSRHINVKKHTFKANDITKGMSQSLDKISVMAPRLRADIVIWQKGSSKTILQIQNYYRCF